MSFLKNESGFVLVEIIIALTIISFMLIVIPRIMLNVETFKHRFNDEVTLDIYAQELMEKMLKRDLTTDGSYVLIEEDYYYMVERETYNTNLNKLTLFVKKGDNIKKYILLKPSS